MTRQEIVDLLLGRGADDEELFASARKARASFFGDRVVIRGVVELTNRCRVNCTFCPMRRDNTSSNSTYTLSDETVLKTVDEIRAAGINVVFIQGGEVPQTTSILERIIPQILHAYGGRAEVLLNLGNKSRQEYKRLKSAGAYSYILKHETANSMLYEQLKGETLDSRLRCMRDLFDLGFKVGTGSIVGLPCQTVGDIADDIILAKTVGAHMISASPFVPAPNTPLASHKAGAVTLTLRAIAIARLMMPGVLIPSVSALQLHQSDGQYQGLRAGANVITVNFTPDDKKSDYLIYGSNRYVVNLQHLETLLSANGLAMGTSTWIAGPSTSQCTPNGETNGPNELAH